MLGQEQKRIYLNISGAKIRKQESGNVETFDFVEGYLTKVYTRDRVFHGERVKYWYLDLQDGDTVFTLGISSVSGLWRSVILSLGSDSFNPSLPVRINPYKKGQYDRVSVYNNGNRLDWVSDLPPVETIQYQGQNIKSFVKREEFISSLVDKVNGKINLSVENYGGV